jgi:DNA-binding transcriptional LysR family regulator
MKRAHLSRLVVLRTVADLGSFRAAADRLAIAPSAVSQAVATLEEELGVRLLARSTRSTRPTDEGVRLLARIAGPLDDIAAALTEAAARPEVPSGPLRITMPMLAANEVIMRGLPEFAARFPQIELEIRTSDDFEDIVASGCDAGLRLGESLETDMIAVKASRPQRGVIVGAPEYFAARGRPEHPRDLAAHNCIRRRFHSGRIYRWELEKAGRSLSVDVTGNLTLPQQDLIRRAALKGLGIAYLFAETVEDDLREGRLEAVLADWCQPFDGFYIYYPSRRQMRPALRAFIDFFRV